MTVCVVWAPLSSLFFYKVSPSPLYQTAAVFIDTVGKEKGGGGGGAPIKSHSPFPNETAPLSPKKMGRGGERGRPLFRGERGIYFNCGGEKSDEARNDNALSLGP